MSTKPLAEVVPLHNPLHLHHTRPVVRVGNGHLLPLNFIDDPTACRFAEEYINAAHAAVVEPLQAKLAMAREAMRDAYNIITAAERESPSWVLVGLTRAADTLSETAAAIDADPPGEWVPLEKYQQLQAVLNDLREEKRDVWRGRCLRALELLQMGGATDYAMAALKGEDE